MEDTIFEIAQYKRSRQSYIWYCTFEYFISILVSDVFLAKLLTHVGMEDWLIGIISSIISLAFLFQLFSLFIAGRTDNPKKVIMFLVPLGQILYMSIFLVPFMPAAPAVKSLIITVMLIGAYFFHNSVASMLFKWANSFVNPKNRATFSAGKEIISLATGIVFTLIIGYIVDSFEYSGNMIYGFLFIAISIFICAATCFLCICLIQKKANHLKNGEKKTKRPFKDVMKNTLGNKNFRNVCIMSSKLAVSRYLTLGFLGTFKTKELLLSVTAVQVINMVANALRLIVSRPFGKYSDKTSYAKGKRLGLIIMAVGFFANIFTTENWFWGIVIFTVCYNVSLAGTNQNASNITYSYVKADYIAQALAIKASIGGVCGFLASLAGSAILAHVQANGNMLCGIPMYGQQLLSAISFVIIIITILFIKFVIEKQEVIHQ